MIALDDELSESTVAPVRRGAVTTCVIVAILAVLFGWPSLGGEFLNGDDYGLIRDHFLVNHPSWPHAGELLFMVHGDLYQPLPMLTFMANYAVGGANPRGYHAVNIGLHALNAVLAAMLLRRLARDGRVGLLGGAMFALHPLAMEAVAWVTGRIILLAATFSLVTLLAFAYRRETAGRWWSIGTLLAWLLALVSKVLPAVPIAAVWCDAWANSPLPPLRKGGNQTGWRPRRWYATVGVLLLVTAMLTGLAYYTTRRLEFFQLMQAETTTSLPTRVLIATGYYFRNYVLPTRLSAWSPPPDHVPFLSPVCGAAAAGWIGLLALMAVSWRRCRPAAIGVGLFVLLIAPFMAAMTARTFLTADRYMYLPILGLHLAVAAWVVRVWDGVRPRGRALVAVLLSAIVGGFWLRESRTTAGVFHDNETQARRTIALYPDDVRAWVELVRTHVRDGDAQKALNVVAAQRKRWPENAEFAAEAAQAWWSLREYRKADAEFRRAVAGRPTNHQARYYWGLTLAALGDAPRAREMWRQILREKDRFLPATTALARSYRDNGELDEAAHWYRRAIELNSHHRDALFELALIHIQRGAWAEAMDRLRDVLRLDPADGQARLNLATCLTRTGDLAGALAIYNALRAEMPDNAVVRFNRAQLLAAMNRPSEAEAEYREILRRRSDDFAAAVGLHELLQSQHRYSELPAVWKQATMPPDAFAGGWRLFADALAGNVERSTWGVFSQPEDGRRRPLARWTDVWLRLDALRAASSAPTSNMDADVSSLTKAIDAATAHRAIAPHERDELRVVVLALLDRSQRNPGDMAALDALAHALLAQGDKESALRCAERLMKAGRGTSWAVRGRELDHAIRGTTNE